MDYNLYLNTKLGRNCTPCTSSVPIESSGSRCVTNCLEANHFIYPVLTSSSATTKKSSSSIFTNFTNMTSEYKNNGNLNKQGSGGNSYYTYMQRKRGNINCNCNMTINKKYN